MPKDVHTGTVEMWCPCCQTSKTILNVPVVGYAEWLGGALIQNALPELSDAQREQLMTGLCEPCQEKIFKEE